MNKAYQPMFVLRKEDAPKFVSLAAYFLGDNDTDAAEAAAQAAVACDPQSPEALSTLGIVLAKTTEFSQAAACFEKVVELAPGDVAAWTNLGECYLSAANRMEAARALRRAMELDPHSQHRAGRRARALVAQTLVKLKKELAV